jgi:hypothetical protein
VLDLLMLIKIQISIFIFLFVIHHQVCLISQKKDLLRYGSLSMFMLSIFFGRGTILGMVFVMKGKILSDHLFVCRLRGCVSFGGRRDIGFRDGRGKELHLGVYLAFICSR